MNRPRAFTIVELIISITIIALLIAVAAVAFKNVRRSAGRTQTLSALRQLVAGHIAYTNENNGQLLPGYLTNDYLVALRINARLQSGFILNDATDSAAQHCDRSCYVWRLAPYLDHQWDAVLADYRDQGLRDRFAQEVSAGTYGPRSAQAGQLGAATYPSFGLNSIFVGGDTFHGGPAMAAYRPWTLGATVANNPQKMAATRHAEVKNPAKLIVFAPTENTAPPPDMPRPALGYATLLPPFAIYEAATLAVQNQQWSFDPQGAVLYSGTGPAGLPFSRADQAAWQRWGDRRLPVAFLDGSTGLYAMDEAAGLIGNVTLPPARAKLMSHWSPQAVSFDASERKDAP